MKFAIFAATILLSGCAYGADSIDDSPSIGVAIAHDEGCEKTKLVFRLVDIDPSFSNEEVLAIKAAATKWDSGMGNRTLHLFSKYDAIDHPDWKFYYEKQITKVIKVESNSILEKTLGASSQTLGLTQGNIIYLWSERINNQFYDKMIGSKLFYAVTLHEMGHDMYLHHVDDKESIMWAASDPFKIKFNFSDYKEFCDKWNCNPEEIEDSAISQEPSCQVLK